MSQKTKRLLSYLAIMGMALVAIPALASYSQSVFFTTTGLLTSSNNLSDVSSTSSALNNILPAQSSVVQNYVLTSNGATSSWQNIPVVGGLNYYWTTVTATSTYYLQQTSPTSTQNTIASSSLDDTGVIANFITATSVPSVTYIPAGVYTVHVHAAQTGGTKLAAVYAEIWEVNSQGVDIAKIGTTDTSMILPIVQNSQALTFANGNVYTMASTGSRIVTRVRASVTGAGTAPTVTLYAGAGTDSYTDLPNNAVNAALFLQAGNNLSDVSSTSTSLTNLGGVTKTAVNYPIQWILENPTATENDGIFIFNATSTIKKIVAVNKSLNDTITFGLGYSSNRQTATSSLNNLFTAAQTVTATTTPVTLSINASSTPNTNDNLIFWTTAASSSQFTMTAYYNEN